MTSITDRVREIVLQLPEVEERAEDGQPVFFVAGEAFARMSDAAPLRLYGGDGWAAVAIGDDADWAAIEDRIAQSWELAAPAHLLEAGGR